MVKKSLLDKCPGEYEQKFECYKTYLGYFMTMLGKKLLFMGGEFGQFIEWNYKQQLDWLLLEYPKHAMLHDYVKDLNFIYKDYPCLYQEDYSYDGFRWIVVDDNVQNVFAYIRYDKSGKYLITVLNFSPIDRPIYKIGVPDLGVYKTVIISAHEKYGGTLKRKPTYKSKKGKMHEFDNHIQLNLKGNSCIILEFSKK